MRKSTSMLRTLPYPTLPYPTPSRRPNLNPYPNPTRYRNTITTQERIITKMQSIVESRLRDVRPDAHGHHGSGDHHRHDLHGLMPSGAIGAWMGDESVLDEEQDDAKVHFTPYPYPYPYPNLHRHP